MATRETARTELRHPDCEPAAHREREPEPRSNIAWQAIVVRLAESLVDTETQAVLVHLLNQDPVVDKGAKETRLRVLAEQRSGLLYRLQAAERELASFEPDDDVQKAVVFDAMPFAAMPRWVRPLAHAWLAVRRDGEWRRRVGRG